MEISGGQYTFSGNGSITGVEQDPTFSPARDGSLTVSGGTTTARFENSLDFSRGGITVKDGAALTYAGSSALKGDLNVTGAASGFTFDISADQAYDYVISGGGGLSKTGGGSLTLTADSGGFTGQTIVGGGGLLLDPAAILGGEVTVSGAAVGGTENGVGRLTGSLTLINATLQADPDAAGLTVDGAIEAAGTQSLNLTKWSTGVFTVLSSLSGVLETDEDYWTLLYNGSADLGSRRNGQVVLNGSSLQVDLEVTNTTLTWTGAASAWDGASQAWTDPDNNLDAFADGDAVIFTGSAANQNIYVGGDQTVASLTVTGGDYLFRGGSITGDGAGSSLPGSNNGNLVITGGSAEFQGAASFQGGAQVQSGGSLALSGPGAVVASDVLVDSGGTYRLGLGGSLTGHLEMRSGSILNIAGAGVQTASSASLDSGLKAQLDYLTWTAGATTTLLSTGDLAGSFREQTISAAAFSGQLKTSGNDLVLEVTEAPGDHPGQVVGGTGNQKSTLDAVGSLPDNHPLKNILALPTKQEARRAADTLSGEGRDGTASALMSRQRGFGADTGRRVSKKFKGNYRVAPAGGDGGTVNYLWAEIGAGESKVKGSSGAAEAKLSGPQISLGLEGQTADGWLGGVALTYGDYESKVDGRRYKADIDALGLNFWGGRDFRVGEGRLRALIGLGLSRYEIDATRTVAFSGFYDRLKAEHRAKGLDFFGEVSYSFEAGEWLTLEPFANLTYNRLHFKEYREKGGPAALEYEAETDSGLTGVLGLRGTAEVGERVGLGLSLGWRHNYGDLDSSAGRAFRDGSDRFLVKGAGLSRNALEAGLDLNLGLTERVGVTLSYDGLYGSNERSHGGSARFTWEW